MSDRDAPFFPLALAEQASRPLLQLFSALLLLASLWSLVNQLTLWDRPVSLAVGKPGPLQEERQGQRVRYRLPFTLEETGEEMTLWVRNNGPVAAVLAEAPSSGPVGVRYWTDDQIVFEVHPLVYGVRPVRDPVPPSGVLLGTSLLGLAAGLVLLFPAAIDRALYRLGRRSRRR